MIHSNLYSIAQVRELEQMAYKQQRKCCSESLMQRAGKAALRTLRQHWPLATSIGVVCGGGHNAGDGYVMAQCAKQQGLAVKILCLVPPSALKGLAYKMAYQCQKNGVPCQTFAASDLQDVDVIVDAILGIGLNEEIKEPYLKAIMALNTMAKPILSIDVPSGLDADTGQVMGVSVYADVTITLIALKRGLFTGLGPARCGQVVLDQLGLSKSFFGDCNLNPFAVCLEDGMIPRLLKPRLHDTHKGNQGHVLLIGGNYGMGGSVYMASAAAARVGAGLVSVATRPEHIHIMTGMQPELMCHGVEEKGNIDTLLEKASVIAIGPGLGQDAWGKNLLDAILVLKKPVLLDADALNCLATYPACQRDNWLLTPHPGEAARMLGRTVADIQIDRFEAVKALQARYGGVCVLKGASTLIRGTQEPTYLCTRGNPGMASGGMGDVLTGVLAGLMAQQLSVLQAAKVGVLLHAKAADIAAQQNGERGLLATDLLPYLRQIVNDKTT